MTVCQTSPKLARVDELLVLRRRIQEAFARRNEEPLGSPAWQAADAGLEALHRRVWKRHDLDPVARRAISN